MIMSLALGASPNLRTSCSRILDALRAQDTPRLSPEEIHCFAPSVLVGDPHVGPDSLAEILTSLTEADIPTLERAIEAIDADEQAWLGFKIVTDPVAALDSEDTDVVALRGRGLGCADGRHGVFLVIDATGERGDAELVFGRPYSDRDRLQVFDITRGPQMHDEHYVGVAWKSVPLFRESRVFIMGAGTVGAEVERLANRVGFRSLVVDCDPAYLNVVRFPLSERILIGSFDAIPGLGIGSLDFVCVLTRGHMHDPQALVHGVKAGAAYVGMMGCAEKNERVFDLAEKLGINRAGLWATHSPIGLMFGAKSSVVAELIQVRQNLRSAKDGIRAH